MKSKNRIKHTAEVFTPDWLVQEVLNKLPEDNWQEGKTFLDNSCGDGNFLVAILFRKLQNEHDSLGALNSIYGVDIMRDNIQKCRCRMLDIICTFGVKITFEHCYIVIKNIKWLNPSKFPSGSLDYDFNFSSRPKNDQVQRLYNKYHGWPLLGNTTDTIPFV